MAEESGGAPSGGSLLDPTDTFATLCTTIGLDIRLRKALSRLGYVRPTLVQSRSLPLAITSGRDLLVRARTGSGKTLAYCLPLLQKILSIKLAATGGDVDLEHDSDQFVRAVVLVPTRELCSQVHQTLLQLTYYCDEVVSVAVLFGGGAVAGKKESRKELAKQEAMLRDRPDVIVSTPAGLLAHIRSGALVLKASVQSLVVDEADLVLSYGYAGDIAEIVKALPKICQGFLMSATLSPELNSLKRVVLHSPAVLKLEEADERKAGKEGKLSQFYLLLPRKDKFLVTYVFLKLGLLKGKGLFFVNKTEGGYRLKLFLEQFHIRSAVLNAELPLRSRLNIIEQFNAGNFDYLIATDESTDTGSNGRKDTEDENEEGTESQDDTMDRDSEGDSEDDSDRKSRKKGEDIKKAKIAKRQAAKGKKKDSEYGVARGLDFRGVSFVVNFDLPLDNNSYTHRIGRTARGGAKGVALSFVEMENKGQNEILDVIQQTQTPLSLAAPIAPVDDNLRAADGGGEGSEDIPTEQVQLQPTPLDFDIREVEGFRYRVEDVSRAVTKTAVRETRAAELRAEIMNSERLQNHFADNPADLQLLRHDRVATHVSKVQDHLKHVPKYMLPRGMQVAEMNKRKRKRRSRSNTTGTRRTDNDPLQSYEDGGVSIDDVADGEAPIKKQNADVERKVLMNTSDGTGKSTAGRNSWKEKHGRGKFSRRFQKKHGDKGKAGW